MAVAVISLIGSGGSLAMTHKLISYRIEKLEEIVRERSTALERIYILEKNEAVTKEQIREISTRLDNLETERSDRHQ